MASGSTIIAIDGPSASGKSSTSKATADALGFHYADTGSMYRAFAWKVFKDKIDPHNVNDVIQLMNKVRYECDFVEVPNGPQSLRHRLDGEDPGLGLRDPEVEKYASIIATIPEVRNWLVEKQRSLADQGNLVVEGRDIGTVVFPNTPYKFFLTANPEIRAKRRTADQAALGVKTHEAQVSQAIAERDHRDSTRSAAPLKPAPDALQIDTSYHAVADTVDVILKYVRSKHVAEN
jgi:cytidylate kinase